jgi:hypothetical protein
LREPYGFVFVVEAESLAGEVLPDEDDVARFVSDHATETGRLDRNI